MKIVMLCTEIIILFKKNTGIGTVHCDKLTPFDPKSPFLTLKVPWLCWKWLLTMGCGLYQPQSRSELWLDLGSYLFGIQKEGGKSGQRGERALSSQTFQVWQLFFGPILLSQVTPCWFLKVHRVVNFYFGQI